MHMQNYVSCDRFLIAVRVKHMVWQFSASHVNHGQIVISCFAPRSADQFHCESKYLPDDSSTRRILQAVNLSCVHTVHGKQKSVGMKKSKLASNVN